MGIVKRMEFIYHYTQALSRILRFDRVNISVVADASKCEWKKVLEEKYGKLETEEMREGTLIHEKVFSSNIKNPDIAEIEIKKRGKIPYELKVAFLDSERKLLVSGRVDSALVDGDKIERIIELKTRKSIKIYESDILQGGLYALSVERMLNTKLDDLEIEIKIIPRNEYKDGYGANKRIKNPQIGFSEVFKFGDIRKFVLEKTNDILDFFSNKREPRSAIDHHFCSRCEFISICDKKIVR